MPKHQRLPTSLNTESSPKKSKLIVEDDEKGPRVSLPSVTFSTKCVADATKELEQQLPWGSSYCEGLARLGNSLQIDDPGLFVALRTPDEVHQLMDQSPVNGRPFERGQDAPQTYTNLVRWITRKAGDRGIVTTVGPHALAIGNLSQQDFANLCGSLNCAKNSRQPWAGWFLQNDTSLGGLVSVTGTGPGSATMCVVTSCVFRDTQGDDSDDEDD